MRIEFLGTGGYHPNERRHTTSVLLPECGLFFDAGTSFFRASKRLQTSRVQIFLSHAHLDHIAGLTYFLLPLMHGRVRQAAVYANEQTISAVKRHLFAESVFPILPDFDFHTLDDSAEIEVGCGGTLRLHPLVSHPGGSTAFRVDWPATEKGAARSLAFVTDTTVDGTYTDFVRGVNVLIHECNYPDAMAEWCEQTGHSHTSQVARLAAEAGVGSLWLMHVDPQLTGDDPLVLAGAREVFPETNLAEDLQTVEF